MSTENRILSECDVITLFQVLEAIAGHVGVEVQALIEDPSVVLRWPKSAVKAAVAIERQINASIVADAFTEAGADDRDTRDLLDAVATRIRARTKEPVDLLVGAK